MRANKSNKWGRLALASAVLCAVVAVGCSRRQEASADMAASAPDAEAVSAGAPPPAPLEAMPPDAGRARAAGTVQTPGVDAAQFATVTGGTDDPARRFVRTASASFQVADVYAAALSVEDAVAAEGGFVVRNRIATQLLRRHERPLGDGKRLELSEVRTSGSLVVRVPGDRMQSFLRAIARQMQFLDGREFEADDVQFDILRKQLALARAQELQQDIRAAGAQPGKTGDKIDAVQARADLLGARDEARVAQRELEDRIAFATLTLDLAQPTQVREQTVPDTDAVLRERGPGFMAQARDGIVAGWRGLLSAVIVLVASWPLWLVAALAFLALRGLRRRRRAGREARTPDGPESAEA